MSPGEGTISVYFNYEFKYNKNSIKVKDYIFNNTKVPLEIDLNKFEYSNSKALDKYNEIFNSNLISASTKERVKKIHEFQLYK